MKDLTRKEMLIIRAALEARMAATEDIRKREDIDGVLGKVDFNLVSAPEYVREYSFKPANTN